MFKRVVMNSIIAIISLIAVYIIAMSLLGVTIVFPLSVVDDGQISRVRSESVRLATFATFAFYGAMHLLQGSKEVFPVHFLKTWLFFLTILGAMTMLSNPADVTIAEWIILFFFFNVALALQFITAPKYRRYFGKK